jgi:hypothetical protein
MNVYFLKQHVSVSINTILQQAQEGDVLSEGENVHRKERLVCAKRVWARIGDQDHKVTT